MSNRHFHVISYKTQQFSPFDDFFSSTDLSNYSFFTNMLKKIIWDKITAAVIKKKQVTHFTPPGLGKMGHLPGLKKGGVPSTQIILEAIFFFVVVEETYIVHNHP